LARQRGQPLYRGSHRREGTVLPAEEDAHQQESSVWEVDAGHGDGRILEVADSHLRVVVACFRLRDGIIIWSTSVVLPSRSSHARNPADHHTVLKQSRQ